MNRKAETAMEAAEYVRRVLDAYRTTPDTCGVVRKPDRAFALALFARGVALDAVENALVLAASRRLVRPAAVAAPRTTR